MLQEQPTGGTDFEQTALEIGLLTDWVEHDLKVPREKGEMLSAWVKRAFNLSAVKFGEDGTPMHSIVLPELGAATLLANRQRYGTRAKVGNSKFSRVDRDTRGEGKEYSFRREGRTDRLMVVNDAKELRKLTFLKPNLEKRLGELQTRRNNLHDQVRAMRNKMDIDKMNYERLRDEDRNLAAEQALEDQRNGEIRIKTNEIAGLDGEIERVKAQLAECDGATRSKYSKVHEIPSDAKLEVEVRWPLSG